MKVYNGTDWDQLRIVELGNYVSSGLYSYWDVSSANSYSGAGNTLYDLTGNQNLTNSGDTPSVQGTGFAKYFSQSSQNYPYWTASNRNYGLQNASIEIWLFTTNGTSDDYLFNFYSGSTTGNSRALRLSGGQVSLVGNGSSTQDQNSLATLTSNQWYQFVFTYQATDNVVIYKNGASIGSFTKDLTDGGGGNVSLGNTFWYGANDTNVWKGGWAACRYYTKTLTSAEVSINWNGTKSRFGL
jgi:hypothetical protein